MMQKIIVIILGLMLFVFFGCEKTNKIYIKVQEAAKHQEEVSFLKIIDDFEWTHFLFIKHDDKGEFVDSLFRTHGVNREEFTHYWFFLKEEKMVYFEMVPYNIEEILPYQIQFSGSSGVLTIERKQALFKVSKIKDIKKEYYILSPLNEHTKNYMQ